MDGASNGRQGLRAYAPPRLTPAGSLRTVTALSGAPTPTVPPATPPSPSPTGHAAGPSAAGIVGEEAGAPRAQLGAGGRAALPKMPKTGGGMAGGAVRPRRLSPSLAALTLAVGLAASADRWGAERRSRRDCWRLRLPPAATEPAAPEPTATDRAGQAD